MTGTTYRLVTEVGGYRVTKAREDEGQLRLAHLRGQAGVGVIDTGAVARLVAGVGGAASLPADPMAAFAAVVLCDLERTADVMTAVAREAHAVYEAGCRGFRPRSPALKQQRDEALAQAITECRAMAAAWRESGLLAGTPLPEWMLMALGDLEGRDGVAATSMRPG